MSKPSDQPQMSTILPRFVMRRLAGFIERRLPLHWWDRLNHFQVQTRLIFSRAILLLVGALFLLFTWSAIAQQVYKPEEVFDLLTFQVSILAILLNMNLWEMEREGHTFELLIMRIPNLRRLIWFKLRISFFWIMALSFPFFVGFDWFTSIPLGKFTVMAIFVVSFAWLIGLLTCVIASFIHQALATGIVTFILMVILMSICENADLWKFDYYRLYIKPFQAQMKMTGLTVRHMFWILLVNRCMLAAAGAGLYAWLHRRLAKTEKWI